MAKREANMKAKDDASIVKMRLPFGDTVTCLAISEEELVLAVQPDIDAEDSPAKLATSGSEASPPSRPSRPSRRARS